MQPKLRRNGTGATAKLADGARGGSRADHVSITSTRVVPAHGAEERTAGVREGTGRERGGNREGREGLTVNKNSKVGPTGNSEPKSVLKSLLSTSSKI